MKQSSPAHSYVLPVLFRAAGACLGDYFAREAIELSYSSDVRGISERILQEYPYFVRSMTDVTFGSLSASASSVVLKSIWSAKALVRRFKWE
ncbi:MAG: hypothetical protein AABY00_01760 [Nanoarchaeota archaeon]